MCVKPVQQLIPHNIHKRQFITHLVCQPLSAQGLVRPDWWSDPQPAFSCHDSSLPPPIVTISCDASQMQMSSPQVHQEWMASPTPHPDEAFHQTYHGNHYQPAIDSLHLLPAFTPSVSRLVQVLLSSSNFCLHFLPRRSKSCVRHSIEHMGCSYLVWHSVDQGAHKAQNMLAATMQHDLPGTTVQAIHHGWVCLLLDEAVRLYPSPLAAATSAHQSAVIFTDAFNGTIENHRRSNSHGEELQVLDSSTAAHCTESIYPNLLRLRVQIKKVQIRQTTHLTKSLQAWTSDSTVPIYTTADTCHQNPCWYQCQHPLPTARSNHRHA